MIVTGASDPVRAQLARGGVVETDGLVFEPDLDRGLQRCEDALLSAPSRDEAKAEHPAAGAPTGCRRASRPTSSGSRCPPAPSCSTKTIRPETSSCSSPGAWPWRPRPTTGTRLRLRTLRPGVVVGEVTLYTDVPRTADVVAEVPSVVLKIGRAEIERLEREQPELAATLHRWLATQLAERLTDTMRTFDVLLD